MNASGAVGVTYYDFRNLQAGNTTTLPTEYWLAVSIDGGKSFGDYAGLTSAGNTFHPLFVQANSGNTANRTDVFATAATSRNFTVH